MALRPPLPPAATAIATTAVGLLAASVRRASRLPVRAAGLPVRAARRVGSALPVPEGVRREYDALAERGAAVVSRLHRPAASEEPAGGEPAAPDAPAATAVDDEMVAGDEPVAVDAPVDGGAPATTAMDAGARAAERETGDGVFPRAALDPDELPVPDFDHLTLGSIRGRLRRLSLDELLQLREYEAAHGNRLPIVTMLDNRIAKLTVDRDDFGGQG